MQISKCRMQISHFQCSLLFAFCLSALPVPACRLPAGRQGRQAGDRQALFIFHSAMNQALSPNIAVPTRTIVAPSSTATSKSPLIPIESSFIETPGMFSRAIVFASSRSFQK